VREINKRHDALHASLIARMRRRRGKGEVAEIQKALEEEQAERRRELRAASRIKWDGVVDWGNGSKQREEYWLLEE